MACTHNMASIYGFFSPNFALNHISSSPLVREVSLLCWPIAVNHLCDAMEQQCSWQHWINQVDNLEKQFKLRCGNWQLILSCHSLRPPHYVTLHASTHARTHIFMEGLSASVHALTFKAQNTILQYFSVPDPRYLKGHYYISGLSCLGLFSFC